MKRLLILLIFTCACITIRAQVNIITTICGNDTAAYYGDGGLAVGAKINYPSQLCLDKFGNLYIADALNHRIRKIHGLTGVITTVAGTGIPGYNGDGASATESQLLVPQAVAVDSSGNIYIGDALNYRIRKVTISTGIITTIAGNGISGNTGDGGLALSAKIGSPGGLYFDKYDNLYMADIDNCNIRKITPDGVIKVIAGNGTIGYSGDGGLAIHARLNGPGDMALDTAGNLIISDAYNHVLRKVDAVTGVISTIAGNGTSGYSGDGGLAIHAQLNSTYGIFIDKWNDIYFTEWGNGTIRKIEGATGRISTVAGTGVQGYCCDDGPATNAKLVPDDVVIDSNGTIFIADFENHRIRKIYDPTLAVTSASVVGMISVYPNPASDVLTVEGAQNTTMVLCDVVGKVVMERKLNGAKETIDISSLNNGVYVVQVYDAVHNTRSMTKLVVAR